MVSSTKDTRPEGTSKGDGGYGKVGFREITTIGWGRLWRRITGDIEG